MPAVEVVVEALIREHLTKRQLVATLAAYKQEQPALPETINKRSILQSLLGLTSGVAATATSGSTLEQLVQAQLRLQSGQQQQPEQKQPAQKQQSQRQQMTFERRLPALQQQQQQPVPAALPDRSRSAVQPPCRHVQELRLDDVDVDAEDSSSEGLGLHGVAAAAAPASAGSAARPHARSRLAAPAAAGGGGWSTGGGSSSSNSSSSPMLAAGLEALPPEQQRHLALLVWGSASAQPDAAWQQGFIWCERPGLEWGLVQTSGGPCGVLAAVQAHLVATLMEQGLWQAPQLADGITHGSSSQGQPAVQAGTPPTRAQLQDALADSLALMLWQCTSARASDSSSSQPMAQVVLLPVARQSGMRGLCDAAQVLRLARAAPAHSQAELQALVRGALPLWSVAKGWGLLLFLYSVLLSRGCAAVRADMDDACAAGQLVDGLGYCAMELVNLLVTGAAVSNVFDGARRLTQDGEVPVADAAPAALAQADALVLRGVAARARVGLLTLYEWYRYVEVGQHLKAPRLPVWVVCSESHFTVVAAGPGGSATQQLPLQLVYFDGFANQETPIVLGLTHAQPGQEGWTSRMAGVAEERGVWRGQPIPPLEAVLATRWPDAVVSWHGSEPIM